MTTHIWKVYGSDANVFGAPKRRTIEVAAEDRDEARTEALRLFPTLTVESILYIDTAVGFR